MLRDQNLPEQKQQQANTPASEGSNTGEPGRSTSVRDKSWNIFYRRTSKRKILAKCYFHVSTQEHIQEE